MHNSVSTCVIALFMALLSVCAKAEESLGKILSETLRLSPEQVKDVLTKPIPEHAQREIDYGFVDEEFVRFMMGIALVRDKIRILNGHNLQQLNPWMKMNSRYRCTSIGLQEILEYPMGSYSNDCLYLWPEFLSNGPELPFDIDFPLVELLEPWSNPTESSLDSDKRYAQEFVDTKTIKSKASCCVGA